MYDLWASSDNGTLPNGTVVPYFNMSDPANCPLWGVDPYSPISYMKRQCNDGYGGNLCAVCTSVDGKQYASEWQSSSCAALTTSS